MADPPTTHRFCLVDDTTAIRAAAEALMPTLDLVSTHSCVEELLETRPEVDVVIVDLHLANQQQPGVLHGLAAVQSVVGAGYTVCVYTQEERRFVLAACIAAGALGVVSKSLPLRLAEEAFHSVARGELAMPPSVTGIVEVLSKRGHLTLLSPQQRDLLAGRARGLTYAELARTLYVSPSTLRGYWSEVSRIVGKHLDTLAPGDIEHAFGMRPGDLLGTWPDPARRARRDVPHPRATQPRPDG